MQGMGGVLRPHQPKICSSTRPPSMFAPHETKVNFLLPLNKSFQFITQ